jgi:hypothetical protein
LEAALSLQIYRLHIFKPNDHVLTSCIRRCCVQNSPQSVYNTFLNRTHCPLFGISAQTQNPSFALLNPEFLVTEPRRTRMQLFWYLNRQRPCLPVEMEIRFSGQGFKVHYVHRSVNKPQSFHISKIFNCLVFKSRLQSYVLRLLTKSVKVTKRLIIK